MNVGLVGIKRDEFWLSLRINMSKGLLWYVCNLRFKSENTGLKNYVCEANIMGAWWCWDFVIIKMLGIFKPQFSGLKEQYKYYYI